MLYWDSHPQITRRIVSIEFPEGYCLFRFHHDMLLLIPATDLIVKFIEGGCSYKYVCSNLHMAACIKSFFRREAYQLLGKYGGRKEQGLKGEKGSFSKPFSTPVLYHWNSSILFALPRLLISRLPLPLASSPSLLPPPTSHSYVALPPKPVFDSSTGYQLTEKHFVVFKFIRTF